MSKKLKVTLIVCISLVLLGLIFCGAARVMGFSGSFGITMDMKYVDFTKGNNNAHLEKTAIAPFTDIEALGLVGDTRFVPSDGYYIEYNFDGPVNISYGVENGVLRLNAAYSGGKNELFLLYMEQGPSLLSMGRLSDKGNITVYYPEGSNFNSVNIENSFGDMKISGLSCSELNITASAGDIELAGIAAVISLVQNEFGEIDVHGLSGDSAEFILSAGDLSLENVTENISLKVQNHFGDVDIAAVSAGNISITNNNGDVAMTGFSAQKVDITDDFGDIDLKKPENPEGTSFDLLTDFGDIEVFGRDYGSRAIIEKADGPSVTARNNCGDITVK
ncbi:MAG: DUF4097 family beta strand repeat protein [Oscillospiraceae bacterium]|nr:DUF4097 family beta strand repeat protein [Oscillospiraceae bacterium]